MSALRYKTLRKTDKRMLTLTGLKVAEFETLHEAFARRWQHHVDHFTLEGLPRQRKPRRQRINAQLPTTQDMLLFILYYLKTNPLQEVLAAHFDLTQPHANLWIKRLQPRLEEALHGLNPLPERDLEKASSSLKAGDWVIIDGAERPIQRPKDTDNQRDYYSGKKSGIPAVELGEKLSANR